MTDECVTEIVKNKNKLASMPSQMENSEENSGIWTLCGDLKALRMKKDGGGVQFDGEMADLEATYLVGKIKAKAHPFCGIF